MSEKDASKQGIIIEKTNTNVVHITKKKNKQTIKPLSLGSNTDHKIDNLQYQPLHYRAHIALKGNT